jgi:hypothetical protein
LVFEQVRLKALELESQRYGREIGLTQLSALSPPPPQFCVPAGVSSSSISAAHLISRGIESYLQEVVAVAMRSQLATLGMVSQDAAVSGEAARMSAPQPGPTELERVSRHNGRSSALHD